MTRSTSGLLFAAVAIVSLVGCRSATEAMFVDPACTEGSWECAGHIGFQCEDDWVKKLVCDIDEGFTCTTRPDDTPICTTERTGLFRGPHSQFPDRDPTDECPDWYGEADECCDGPFGSCVGQPLCNSRCWIATNIEEGE